MTVIRTLTAQEILDSRQTPTIEVTLATDSGTVRASVPSGASVGSREALELRDNDPARFGGRGVLKALDGIHHTIAPRVVGTELTQNTLDTLLCELDGTSNKTRLGANATLAISIAFARASAQEAATPLYRHIAEISGQRPHMPTPMCNIINGGKHTTGGIDIQECMLVPTGVDTIETQVHALHTCIATLKQLLIDAGFDTKLGDEGGFAPSLPSNEVALSLLAQTIEKSGFTFEQIQISLDAAANSFYSGQEYTLHTETSVHNKSPEALMQWYEGLSTQYPLFSIEDPFREDDWDSFTSLTKNLAGRTRVIGDDLLVTNAARIKDAGLAHAVNGVIIKPNQIGTVSEAIAAVLEARKASMLVCASHRSGETLDTFIADFAVGVGADFIKAGAPTRPERTVKYDRLIEIATTL